MNIAQHSKTRHMFLGMAAAVFSLLAPCGHEAIAQVSADTVLQEASAGNNHLTKITERFSLECEGSWDSQQTVIDRAEQTLKDIQKRVAGRRSTQKGKPSESGKGFTVTVSGAYSVMDKDRTAPSGDKHDYYTLAPYFWPSDTPTGLPYVPHDGKTNPQNGLGTDRQAWKRMAASLNNLALAYALTGSAEYAKPAALLVRVWFLDEQTRMNPNLNYSQSIPGVKDGGPNGIIDFHDLPGVLDSIALIRDSGFWTADDQKRMQQWAVDFRKWLQESTYGQRWQKSMTPANIGSWYWTELASLALFVGDLDAARQIVELAKTRLVATQIDPNGVQLHEIKRTKSFHYSLFNLQALMILATIGKEVGVDLFHYTAPNEASIRKALDFVAFYADPQKRWPYKEILNNHAALIRQMQPLLEVGTREYDGAYKKELEELGDGHLT